MILCMCKVQSVGMKRINHTQTHTPPSQHAHTHTQHTHTHTHTTHMPQNTHTLCTPMTKQNRLCFPPLYLETTDCFSVPIINGHALLNDRLTLTYSTIQFRRPRRQIRLAGATAQQTPSQSFHLHVTEVINLTHTDLVSLIQADTNRTK